MKFITKYIKEGFFGNLGIDTPGDIRHIFDELSKLSKDYSSIYGFRNPDTATKYGFAFKYYDYYTHLSYVRGALARTTHASSFAVLEHQKRIVSSL